MKIIHVADLHFGVRTHSTPDPETGIPSRISDVGRAWSAVVDVAENERADSIIVAGDAFHGRDPDHVSIALFAAGLRRATSAGIDVGLIPGNHDRGEPGTPSVVEAFATSERSRDRVIVQTEPGLVDVGGLTIGALPWVSRQHVAAGGLGRADADDALRDGLVRIIDGQRRDGADVLVGHWTVEGATVGGEVSLGPLVAEPVLPLAELAGDWYVAMGHIHKAQRLGADGFESEVWRADGSAARLFGTYSGSIDRMNFGEEGQDKGGWIVDLEERSVRWFDVPAREFVTIDYHGEGFDGEDLARIEGAVVRLRNVPTDRARAWQMAAAGAGADVVLVETSSETHERVQRADVEPTAGPLDALEDWFDVRAIEDQDRPPLRAEAGRMLEAQK